MHDPKEIAGRQAAELVRDGMRLGLGTGSTVHFAIVRLAERVREQGLAVRCVPTSADTEKKARSLGIPLVDLAEVDGLDLTIDGADEIDGRFDMIKGGGGALLREKVVASISREEAIVVGANKVVSRLGTTFPLPVEIVPFARAPIERALAGLGCRPSLRTIADRPFASDNGNWILDCRFPSGIEDAAALERRIDAIPGVVESGLFIGLAHVVFIGREDGTCEVRRRGSSDPRG
jgi:ribose 5-phosphate isomerase A